MEDSPREDQSQYIIGEDGEGHRSVCKGGLFHSHGHEEIHSSTDESKEDYIRPKKPEHSPTVSQKTQKAAGFYSKDWDAFQQEEDEWQRISQMVFWDRRLKINPEYISSYCTQHQGG